jgi:multicomponent Na+:H+ antiporter subunit D
MFIEERLMSDNLLILPILIPLLTAIVTLLLWNYRNWQRVISVIGAALHLLATFGLLMVVRQNGIQAVQIGNWSAPFGITLVADLFSAIMLVLTGIIGLAVAIYSLGNIDARREAFGYYPLYHVLLMGISGAFLTGDMFNLYVWFEVMLIASFVLMALGGERPQMEGALKYVTLNLMASAIFLAAVGVLYGVTGTLNMADLATQLPRIEQGLANTLAMMFLVAFGIKAAVFPLFFWLPAAYHTPPAAVSAIFAGMLTKVGVYALIRVFTLLFIQDIDYTHLIILVIAAFTMTSGVLGAASQFEFRRILSFHIISQIGYMIMGLALFSPLALAGAVFYIMHHIIVKANLFLVSGAVNRLQGSYQLKSLGGLYRSRLGLAVLFLIPALSLAGLPPLSGFWAKLTIIQAGVEQSQFVIVAIALGVGMLTLYSMIKIWNEVFWKAKPDQVIEVENNHTSRWNWFFYISPIVVLALFTLMIGLVAEPFFQLAQQTAAQLLDPTQYIQTVLGGGL